MKMHYRNERLKRQTRRRVASWNMINATFCATIKKWKTCKWIAISALSRERETVERKRQRQLDTRVIRDERVEMQLRVWLNNSSSAIGCARRATTIAFAYNLEPGMQLACLLLYLIFYLCPSLPTPLCCIFLLLFDWQSGWSACLSVCLPVFYLLTFI